MPQTDIDLNTLAKYFHLPITEVARKLGVRGVIEAFFLSRSFGVAQISRDPSSVAVF
jgi:hypothetical protein